LGLLFPIYGKIKKMLETTNQIFIFINQKWRRATVIAEPKQKQQIKRKTRYCSLHKSSSHATVPW
jgi:hypothetical protein